MSILLNHLYHCHKYISIVIGIALIALSLASLSLINRPICGCIKLKLFSILILFFIVISFIFTIYLYIDTKKTCINYILSLVIYNYINFFYLVYFHRIYQPLNYYQPSKYYLPSEHQKAKIFTSVVLKTVSSLGIIATFASVIPDTDSSPFFIIGIIMIVTVITFADLAMIEESAINSALDDCDYNREHHHEKE